jgi:fructose-bisphosphate aldolase class II
MLVNVASMLGLAERDGYAVGSFNVFDMQTMLGVFDALRGQRSPGVVAITRRHVPLIDLEGFAAMIRRSAIEADVPVALHLDHATDVDLIERALAAGFTSVMYDGSGLPLDQRIERTRHVVELAHAHRASAEAELEHMGRLGVEAGGGSTDPRAAGEFARRTGIDVLAVAIGNIHGSIGADIRLDLDLLASLRASVACHLSLHGGSGIPKSQLRSAIQAGVSKVSFFHGMAEAGLQRLQASIHSTPPGELAALTAELRLGFRERCSELIYLVGSEGRERGATGAIR